MRAICEYAVTLTLAPGSMRQVDLARLRAVGLDDRAIVDANQVVAYFNYVNRVAHGLGVELEPHWPVDAHVERGSHLRRRSLPRVDADALAWITVDEMREVDRVTIHEVGITLEQTMENAGRALAAVAIDMVGGAAGRRIAVLAGSGGNGGGGMAAARHLAHAGAEVEVHLGGEGGRLAPATRHQLRILQATGVRVREGRVPRQGGRDLVVDALLGYGQTGPPHGVVADLVRWTSGMRVLSLDVPTGLDLETATAHDPRIRAEATVTLGLPKRALGGRKEVGRLLLADVSVPPAVFARLRIPYRSPFGSSPLVEVVTREP